MVCELGVIDCGRIGYAVHKLGMCTDDLSNQLKKRISKHGKEDDITEVIKSQISSTNEARTDLAEIANKCGCNVDLETGKFK